ncbi:MAG: DUF4397 domain-containing protein [Planctomycetota bacterium]|nr:DUF4397 domain-containing protein [Planctomycetota bacterium]
MTRTATKLLPLASFLLLAACGGAMDSNPPTAAAPADATAEALRSSWGRSVATVYVVHGINGKDLALPEALPVDVQVGDTCALTDFQFRNIAGPISLPPGTYDVKVRLAATPACSGAEAISAPGLKLDGGANVSIVAHLADAATATPTASVFANDVTIAFGRSRAIARHAANFGGVDVLVDGKVAFADLTNGEQGVATLRPGQHTLAIAPAGSSTPVYEKDLRFKPYVVYAAYAVGTPANGTFEVLLQTLPMSRWPEREKPATAYVVHGINGKDLGLPEALPVDVELGGKCVLQNFKFRDIAGPVKLDAGTYDVNVRLAAEPACSGAVAIAAPGLKLAPGANVSIVAHLADAATATPTASVFPNDTTRTHGKGRVVARHGANFGPVDVLVNGAVAFPDLANGQQEMADLKRGTYKIAIAPAGTSTEVFSTELKVKPGRAYNAYAVGTPANGTFEVLLQVTPIARHCDLSRGEGHD